MSDERRKEDDDSADPSTPGCAELTEHIVSYFIARDAFDDRPALKATVEQHLASCPACTSKGRALRSALAAMDPPSPEMTEWAWRVLREAARRDTKPAG